MPVYNIQEEIITKAKYWGVVLSSDLVYMLLLFQFAAKFREHVVPTLGNFTVIVIFLFGLYWILPNASNSQKRNYHRLVLSITKNRQTYHPIASYDFSLFFDRETELSDVLLNENEWRQEMIVRSEGAQSIENFSK
ncbi:hypothetical protein RV11_GL003174 [Enterococcus phoeniculicola]|uniref:Uncharacterized protein n=1 Tax=Enterococcus phoeniculicola ATCC BAA-412 TaxID=1158610 RepID=R3WMF7_9ENTE|nr:DUF5592 family protein [Enterococcus phoeniculicola]EOL43010.1 hypothetical protein UC3_01987 [Enterococcus phoeniculicola ATCC BAA-412]EOT76632.1 hypothetical protein I589_01589 [Enterococcus phoeniculicola ATCC BAA-412]OJG72203.1 hypothetical protein RV11_GL003174 [Enterococcus phoeniculicola]